ncbi:MAG: glycine cleavage system aminomethyltransferase GcvT [Nocardioidaceae bacterium]
MAENEDPASGVTPRRSPLHDRHVALGAKFAPFGGWEMPLEYADGGVLKEHAAVRESVGVFDVSHLGKAVVRGPGAAAFVNSCLAGDLERIGPGQAQYTLCCDDPTGGVVDDLIAYLRGPDEVFLIPNAANTAEVCRRLAAAAPDGVAVDDQHDEWAVIAVQGRDSDATLEAAGLPVGHDYMSFVEGMHAGQPVVVCRTGYTGERGYELVVPADAAEAVWDAVLAAGGRHDLRPCGLGARDTLRTEMGYPLHGQDISLDITPVQARLGWAVGWSKPSFWGRAALLAERERGPSRVLRGLVAAGRGIARPGMRVLVDGGAGGDDSGGSGEPIGVVTSGTFAPTLRRGVALALVEPGIADGTSVAVEVRRRREAFVVTKPPFVTPSVR